MLTDPFYHATIRKVTAVFGTLFNDIVINTNGKNIKVPLAHGPRDKALVREDQREALTEGTKLQSLLPRMSFELTDLVFDAGRKVSELNKHFSQIEPNSVKRMYQRTPYLLTYNLYIVGKNYNQTLPILEQILPYFTPNFFVKAEEIPDFEFDTDIPFNLISVIKEDNWDGDFNETREVIWTLTFRSSIYIYGPITDIGLIKHVDVNFKDKVKEMEILLAKVEADVVPDTAGPEDPHTVDVTITDPADVNDE